MNGRTNIRFGGQQVPLVPVILALFAALFPTTASKNASVYQGQLVIEPNCRIETAGKCLPDEHRPAETEADFATFRGKLAKKAFD